MNSELTINTDKVRNSSEEKLLGVTFDNDFSYITHVKRCAKRQAKNYMLYIEPVTMTLSQRRIIMKAFIEYQLVIVHLYGFFMVIET